MIFKCKRKVKEMQTSNKKKFFPFTIKDLDKMLEHNTSKPNSSGTWRNESSPWYTIQGDKGSWRKQQTGAARYYVNKVTTRGKELIS